MIVSLNAVFVFILRVFVLDIRPSRFQQKRYFELLSLLEKKCPKGINDKINFSRQDYLKHNPVHPCMARVQIPASTPYVG